MYAQKNNNTNKNKKQLCEMEMENQYIKIPNNWSGQQKL